MSEHISITEYFNGLDNFLHLAPQKLIDFFWEDFKKAHSTAESSRNILKEKEFVTDWNNIITFFLKGDKIMEEKADLNYQDILDKYNEFKIPDKNIPLYNGNPEDFVSSFKKVTLLKPSPTYYAAGTKSLVTSNK